MKYFGIAKCPYCKKRINLIRIWRLKKHGEYVCPRCKGISNIYHSPLIYALALLCCAAGFLIFFFEKYITDTVDLITVVKVLIPFALFFVLSLFMVYLEKPVIRRVFKREDGKMVNEKGEVVSIAVNTILSSGGKKLKNSVRNPANKEVADMVNTLEAQRNNNEMIRVTGLNKVNRSEETSEPEKIPVKTPIKKPEAAVNNSKKENLSEEKTDTIPKTYVPEKVKASENKETVNEELKKETKYTENDIRKLEKTADSGKRDNGQKTIRARYKSESEFDEIFNTSHEINDRKLNSLKKKSSGMATPSIPASNKKSEINIKEQMVKNTEKEAQVKKYREL